MTKKKIGNTIFTIPNPSLIKTEGLGDILLSHWSAEATSIVAEILKNNSLDDSQFVTEFVRSLARTPSNDNDNDISKKYENGGLITEPEKLTDKDIEDISKEYVNKWKNEILYWITYEPDRESFNIDKTNKESYSEYFYRILKISTKKSEELCKKLFDKFNFSNSTKKIFNRFNKNKFKVGVLGERIKEIQHSSNSIPKYKPISDLPENPTHETNNLLRNLLNISETQNTQLIFINEQTESLLLANGELLHKNKKLLVQGKKGIYVAIVFFVLGAITNIYQNRENEKLINKGINKIIVVEKESGKAKNSINFNLIDIKKVVTESNKEIDNIQNAIDKISHKINKFSKDTNLTK